MLRNILGGICINRCGLAAIAGAIGVLTGIECLMSRRTHLVARQPTDSKARSPVVALRQDYFKIRRTKFEMGRRRDGLELGYTYWVVQGFGKHRCFVLCDTWRQAIGEATAKLNGALRRAKAEGHTKERRVILGSLANMQRA